MVKEVRSRILFDNYKENGTENDLGGFSILIECIHENGKSIKILFDTGYDGKKLLENIDKYEEVVEDIDFIILSHGHFDHTGGLTEIVNKIPKRTKILCHPYALMDKILNINTNNELNVGFSANNNLEDLENKAEIIKTKGKYEIAEGIWTTGEVLRKTRYEKLNEQLEKVTRIDNGMKIKDEILDDISLIIKLDNGNKIVITGCCHSGILNVLNSIENEDDNKIISIIGGLQLHKASIEQLEYTYKKLKELPLISLYPQHSTGGNGREYLMKKMPGVYKLGGVGTVIRFKSADSK